MCRFWSGGREKSKGGAKISGLCEVGPGHWWAGTRSHVEEVSIRARCRVGRSTMVTGPASGSVEVFCSGAVDDKEDFGHLDDGGRLR